VVGSFLLTAVQRQWLKAVPVVCSLPGASRLTAAEVQELLWQVLHHWQKLRAEFVPLLTPGERGYLVRQEGWLLQAGEAVCGLAGAQQFEADAVEGLLRDVVKQRVHGLVPLLCGLAGAATISSAGVAALLRQTISWALDAQQQQLLQYVPECVACLCGLTGAQQLDAAALVALLSDAVIVKCGAVVAVLCKLPAAAIIAAGAVQELKQLASRYGNAGIFEAFSRLNS
jgi:hypothetical protein